MSQDPYKDLVEQHFRVYEARTERLPGGTAQLYFLMFPADELETRYEAARKAILERDPDAIVFLRHDGGEDVLVVAPRAPVLAGNNRTPIILFLLTIVTTVLAGAMYWQGYAHVGQGFSWADVVAPDNLLWGFLTLSLPLMSILIVHESAHYIAARKHGLRASLPYFIPFPPILFPIGTLGAFIRMKDPLPNRKALFDVGASGPIAGLIIAIPILFLGVYLTDATAMEIPDPDRPTITLDTPFEIDEETSGLASITILNATAGTYVLGIEPPEPGWSYTGTARITADGETIEQVHDETLQATGLQALVLPANTTAATIEIEWEDNLVSFGDPLLVKGMRLIGAGGGDYLTHPVYFAGWVGLFVTGLNLIPAGQLDGGHVARAVLGDNMRYAAYLSVGVLIYLGFQFQSWFLLAALIMFMGIQHPPPLNDRVKLDPKRMVLAAIVLVVLAATFIPTPFIF